LWFLRFLETDKLERMGKNATETMKMLTLAFGEWAIGKAEVSRRSDCCLRC